MKITILLFVGVVLALIFAVLWWRKQSVKEGFATSIPGYPLNSVGIPDAVLWTDCNSPAFEKFGKYELSPYSYNYLTLSNNSFSDQISPLIGKTNYMTLRSEPYTTLYSPNFVPYFDILSSNMNLPSTLTNYLKNLSKDIYVPRLEFYRWPYNAGSSKSLGYSTYYKYTYQFNCNGYNQPRDDEYYNPAQITSGNDYFLKSGDDGTKIINLPGIAPATNNHFYPMELMQFISGTNIYELWSQYVYNLWRTSQSKEKWLPIVMDNTNFSWGMQKKDFANFVKQIYQNIQYSLQYPYGNYNKILTHPLVLNFINQQLGTNLNQRDILGNIVNTINLSDPITDQARLESLINAEIGHFVRCDDLSQFQKYVRVDFFTHIPYYTITGEYGDEIIQNLNMSFTYSPKQIMLNKRKDTREITPFVMSCVPYNMRVYFSEYIYNRQKRIRDHKDEAYKEHTDQTYKKTWYLYDTNTPAQMAMNIIYNMMQWMPNLRDATTTNDAHCRTGSASSVFWMSAVAGRTEKDVKYPVYQNLLDGYITPDENDAKRPSPLYNRLITLRVPSQGGTNFNITADTSYCATIKFIESADYNIKWASQANSTASRKVPILSELINDKIPYTAVSTTYERTMGTPQYHNEDLKLNTYDAYHGYSITVEKLYENYMNPVLAGYFLYDTTYSSNTTNGYRDFWFHLPVFQNVYNPISIIDPNANPYTETIYNQFLYLSNYFQTNPSYMNYIEPQNLLAPITVVSQLIEKKYTVQISTLTSNINYSSNISIQGRTDTSLITLVSDIAGMGFSNIAYNSNVNAIANSIIQTRATNPMNSNIPVPIYKYVPTEFKDNEYMNYLKNVSNLCDYIGQKYYEYNDGNYQINTIYDLYPIGTSVFDVRADLNPRSNINLSFLTMLNFRIEQDSDILYEDLKTAYSNGYLPVSDPTINTLILNCNMGGYSWMSSNNLSQSNSNAIYYYFLQTAISSNTITTSNIYYTFLDNIQGVRDYLSEMSNVGRQGPDISGQAFRIFLEPVNGDISSMFINSNIVTNYENDIKSSNYKIQSNAYKISAISTSPNAASSFVKTMNGFLDTPEPQDPGNVNVQVGTRYIYDSLPLLNTNSNIVIGKILGVSSYNMVGWEKYLWEMSGDFIENISDERVLRAYNQTKIDSTGRTLEDWQFNNNGEYFNNSIHITHLRGVISNANKEVYYIGEYQYTYQQAIAKCAEYGGVLATADQVRNAQLAGASWCGYGWVSDRSNKVMYPISGKIPASYEEGCGPTAGINIAEISPSGVSGINCYGIKPRLGTPLVRPFSNDMNSPDYFTSGTWNQPQNVVSISVAWTEQEWDYATNKPWLGGVNNDTVSIANRAAVFNYYPDYSIWGQPDWLWDISGDISHPGSKTDTFKFSSYAELGFNSNTLYPTHVTLPVVRINETFLDTDGGRCPEIYCSDPTVLNSLVDQYNTGLRPFTKEENDSYTSSFGQNPTPIFTDISGYRYTISHPGKILRINRVFTTGASFCDIDADMEFGIGIGTRTNNNGQFTLVYPNYAQSNMKLQLTVGLDDEKCSYTLYESSKSYGFINNEPMTLALSSNVSSNETVLSLSNPYYYAPGVLSNFQDNIANIWSDAKSFMRNLWPSFSNSIVNYRVQSLQANALLKKDLLSNCLNASEINLSNISLMNYFIGQQNELLISNNKRITEIIRGVLHRWSDNFYIDYTVSLAEIAWKEVYCIGDSYKYTREEAAAVCEQYGGVLASRAQLSNAQRAGASWCASGWVSDSTEAIYPTSGTIPAIFASGCGVVGINVWTPPSGRATVVCYGAKPPFRTSNIRPFYSATEWNQPGKTPFVDKEVYCIGDYYQYTRAEADAVCARYGGVLASTAQVQEAQRAGASWCSLGWVSDNTRPIFPISSPIPASFGQKCGSSNTVNIDSAPYGLACINCYGIKPRFWEPNIQPFFTLLGADTIWNQPQNQSNKFITYGIGKTTYMSYDTGQYQTAAFRIELKKIGLDTMTAVGNRFSLQLGNITPINAFPSINDVEMANLPNMAATGWPYEIGYKNPINFTMSSTTTFPSGYTTAKTPASIWTPANLMSNIPYVIKAYSNVGTNKYEIKLDTINTTQFGNTYQIVQFAFDTTGSNFMYSITPSTQLSSVFQSAIQPANQSLLDSMRNEWGLINSNKNTSHILSTFLSYGVDSTGGINSGNFYYKTILAQYDNRGDYIQFYNPPYQNNAIIMVEFSGSNIQNMQFIGTTVPAGITMTPITDANPIILSPPTVPENFSFKYFRFTPIITNPTYELSLFNVYVAQYITIPPYTENVLPFTFTAVWFDGFSNSNILNISETPQKNLFLKGLPPVITDNRPIIFYNKDLVKPTHFTFISGSNQNTLIPQWKLEGSLYGNIWFPLHSQTSNYVFPTSLSRYYTYYHYPYFRINPDPKYSNIDISWESPFRTLEDIGFTPTDYQTMKLIQPYIEGLLTPPPYTINTTTRTDEVLSPNSIHFNTLNSMNLLIDTNLTNDGAFVSPFLQSNIIALEQSNLFFQSQIKVIESCNAWLSNSSNPNGLWQIYAIGNGSFTLTSLNSVCANNGGVLATTRQLSNIVNNPDYKDLPAKWDYPTWVIVNDPVATKNEYNDMITYSYPVYCNVIDNIKGVKNKPVYESKNIYNAPCFAYMTTTSLIKSLGSGQLIDDIKPIPITHYAFIIGLGNTNTIVYIGTHGNKTIMITTEGIKKFYNGNIYDFTPNNWATYSPLQTIKTETSHAYELKIPKNSNDILFGHIDNKNAYGGRYSESYNYTDSNTLVYFSKQGWGVESSPIRQTTRYYTSEDGIEKWETVGSERKYVNFANYTPSKWRELTNVSIDNMNNDFVKNNVNENSNFRYFMNNAYLNGPLVNGNKNIIAISVTNADELVYITYDIPYTKMVTIDGVAKNYMGPIGMYNPGAWPNYTDVPAGKYILNFGEYGQAPNSNITYHRNFLGYLNGPWVSGNIHIIGTSVTNTNTLVYIAYDEPFTKMVASDGVAKYYNGPITMYNPAAWPTYNGATGNYILNLKTAGVLCYGIKPQPTYLNTIPNTPDTIWPFNNLAPYDGTYIFNNPSVSGWNSPIAAIAYNTVNENNRFIFQYSKAITENNNLIISLSYNNNLYLWLRSISLPTFIINNMSNAINFTYNAVITDQFYNVTRILEPINTTISFNTIFANSNDYKSQLVGTIISETPVNTPPTLQSYIMSQIPTSNVEYPFYWGLSSNKILEYNIQKIRPKLYVGVQWTSNSHIIASNVLDGKFYNVPPSYFMSNDVRLTTSNLSNRYKKYIFVGLTPDSNYLPIYLNTWTGSNIYYGDYTNVPSFLTQQISLLTTANTSIQISIAAYNTNNISLSNSINSLNTSNIVPSQQIASIAISNADINTSNIWLSNSISSLNADNKIKNDNIFLNNNSIITANNMIRRFNELIAPLQSERDTNKAYELAFADFCRLYPGDNCIIYGNYIQVVINYDALMAPHKEGKANKQAEIYSYQTTITGLQQGINTNNTIIGGYNTNINANNAKIIANNILSNSYNNNILIPNNTLIRSYYDNINTNNKIISDYNNTIIANQKQISDFTASISIQSLLYFTDLGPNDDFPDTSSRKVAKYTFYKTNGIYKTLGTPIYWNSTVKPADWNSNLDITSQTSGFKNYTTETRFIGFRFMITKTRSPQSAVDFGKILFYNNNTIIDLTEATIENPNMTDRLSSKNLINYRNKELYCYDFIKTATYIIKLRNRVEANGFAFITSPSLDVNRDPVSWRLDGFTDKWVKLHEQKADYATPKKRFEITHLFRFFGKPETIENPFTSTKESELERVRRYEPVEKTLPQAQNTGPTVPPEAPLTKGYRYLRFRTIQTRVDSADGVQLKTIAFFRGGRSIAVPPKTRVTNPNGFNESGQGPEAVLSSRAYWFDLNKQPLVFDFSERFSFDSYALVTSPKNMERDPVKWKLEVSDNGNFWQILHDQRTSFEIPSQRLAKTRHIPVVFP